MLLDELPSFAQQAIMMIPKYINPIIVSIIFSSIVNNELKSLKWSFNDISFRIGHSREFNSKVSFSISILSSKSAFNSSTSILKSARFSSRELTPLHFKYLFQDF